ncbi:hypothetical protein CTAYLR_002340 [Chrysophaeum taylorii]|uniref:MIP18 family-like domain-containing protein n=1 Tax=Chrysophaeum taylorii TaxID=2483200 RepID=A0AAD7XM10_9STRA|nr:hypothetical protein CTAYLR_002340 [Chrysophaeum taylorii]
MRLWGRRSLQEEAVRALRGVVDPVLGVDVVSGGLARVRAEGTRVSVEVDVGSAAHPARRAVAEACGAAVEKVGGVREVRITLGASGFGGKPASSPGAASVRCAVAVTSCKGGVGKSTVAWHLARSLWRRGGRVGVLDADVHGPSLPSLVGRREVARPSPAGGGLALPIEAEETGVLRVASLGFVGEASTDPSALRGPLAGRVATQLLAMTDWGELDYLIVDLPPGIGDVPLAVYRDLALDGAVVVTTPSRLAHADVLRGLGLLQQFRVPPLAVVENMAYLEGCGTRIFGDVSTRAQVAATLGLGESSCFEIPLSLAVRDSNEGTRNVDDDDDAKSAFGPLADYCVERLLRAQFRTRDVSVDASFDRNRGAVVVRRFVGDQAREHVVSLDALLDESRDRQPATQKVPPRPSRVSLIGKRAIAIDWSSGLKNDVYDLDALIALSSGA